MDGVGTQLADLLQRERRSLLEDESLEMETDSTSPMSPSSKATTLPSRSSSLEMASVSVRVQPRSPQVRLDLDHWRVERCNFEEAAFIGISAGHWGTISVDVPADPGRGDEFGRRFFPLGHRHFFSASFATRPRSTTPVDRGVARRDRCS